MLSRLNRPHPHARCGLFIFWEVLMEHLLRQRLGCKVSAVALAATCVCLQAGATNIGTNPRTSRHPGNWPRVPLGWAP